MLSNAHGTNLPEIQIQMKIIFIEPQKQDRKQNIKKNKNKHNADLQWTASCIA